MANIYVRSGAAGAGTGADWANAYTTLSAALAAKSAGDSFWVSEDHAESTGGAVTLTSPGTPSNPCFIYCVNHNGAVPPVSADLRTTATVATTGAFALTIAGSAYIYGITFQCGSGANNAILTVGSTAGSWVFIDSCGLQKLGTTGTSTAISLAGSRGNLLLKNTTVKFGSTSDGIAVTGVNSKVRWLSTSSAIQGSIPTTLFLLTTNSLTILEGVDLSALGSGTTLFNGSNAAGQIIFKDCKLGASVTVASSITGAAGCGYVVRSDSSGTNYRSEQYNFVGTETTETTIVRTGGASDGTTPQSRKLTTTANSKWVLPFDALPIVIWNEQITGNITLTLEGTINAGAVPNNDDIWMDVEYPGSAASPLGSFATSTKADNLAAGSALTASSKAWGGGGSAAGWSPFKLSLTIAAPAQKGPITIYVKAAKASTTYYIDPQVSGNGLIKRAFMIGVPSPVMINDHSRFRAGLHPIDQGIAA